MADEDDEEQQRPFEWRALDGTEAESAKFVKRPGK